MAIKKITEFKRGNVRDLMGEVQAALEPIAEKYGLTLDRKGNTYHRDRLPVMLQFLIATQDTDGNDLSASAQAFQKNAQFFGLETTDLGRKFFSNGDLFRVTGLSTRAKRYPVLAVRVRDNRGYKFSAERVYSLLQKAVA